MHTHGGEIAGRQVVEAAFSLMRSRIGKGVTVVMRWSRSGVQELTLPLRGSAPNYTALELFGDLGRMEVSAVGAASLPFDSVAFGYRVVGDDISIDFESVVFKGLAGKLSNRPPSGFGSAYGMDPLTLVLTAFSLIKIITAVLNPKIVITLGGTMEASMVLGEDSIIVDLKTLPTVGIFGMKLGVKSVEILPQRAILSLTGSGWFVPKSTEVTFDLV